MEVTEKEVLPKELVRGEDSRPAPREDPRVSEDPKG